LTARGAKGEVSENDRFARCNAARVVLARLRNDIPYIHTIMEEPPRIERIISSKRISCADAAEFTKVFLQSFGNYLEDEGNQNSEDLLTEAALTSGLQEDMGPQSHAHDNLINFVEYHLGAGSSGVRRMAETRTVSAEESSDIVVKSEANSNLIDANETVLSPKEMRKLEKAKEKEAKRQETSKKKELKRQEKEKKRAEKRRRRSEGGEDGDGSRSKKIKTES